MNRAQWFHEDFHRKNEITAGSERGFGIVFSIVFAVIGVWPLISGDTPRVWSLSIAAALLSVALIRPRWLSLLNRLWFLFGLMLHGIVTPLVMATLFFLVVTPTGMVMRLLGKDPLHRRFEPNAKTYWIERAPSGSGPESMRNQF